MLNAYLLVFWLAQAAISTLSFDRRWNMALSIWPRKQTAKQAGGGKKKKKHCYLQDLRVCMMTSHLQTMLITFSFTIYNQQMHNIVHLLVIYCKYMQNAEYTQLQECLSCITLQFEDNQAYHTQTLTRLSKTAHRQWPELWLNTWVLYCDNDRVQWWSLQSSLWQTNSTVGLHTIPLFIFAFQWLWFSFYKIKVHIEHTKISGHRRCSEKCDSRTDRYLEREIL